MDEEKPNDNLTVFLTCSANELLLKDNSDWKFGDQSKSWTLTNVRPWRTIDGFKTYSSNMRTDI